jgi:thiol-disulfide isomerase/thioredoxin
VIGAAAALFLAAAANAAEAGPALVHDAAGLRAALPGKGVAVVHFWATWCDACTKEAPALARLFAQLAGAGTPIVTVAVEKPSRRAAVRAFLRRQRWTGTALLLDADDPAPLAAALDPAWTGDLPRTMIFADGRRTASLAGPVKAEALRRALDAAAAPAR